MNYSDLSNQLIKLKSFKSLIMFLFSILGKDEVMSISPEDLLKALLQFNHSKEKYYEKYEPLYKQYLEYHTGDSEPLRPRFPRKK